MAKLKRYNIEGREVEEVEFSDQLLEVAINPQIVKDYIVAILANRRQWSANTKGRSEIAHSNKKPHPQKGTGRARQGTIKAAQYKGGATVFGPKPKFNQKVQINRKEKRAAIRSLLAQKITGGSMTFLQLEGDLESPKTKKMVALLKQMGLEGKKVLFLSDAAPETKEVRENVYLSMRNIPKLSFMPATNINGYDLMKSTTLLVTDGAIAQIEYILNGWK